MICYVQLRHDAVKLCSPETESVGCELVNLSILLLGNIAFDFDWH